MTRKGLATLLGLLFIALALPASFAGTGQPQLEQEFRTAVAQYEAGNFSEAAARLEKIEREAPASFEVEELLGMAYTSQSQHAKAAEHFQKAAQLNPTSVAARTNLATTLVQLGKLVPAEAEFKRAVELAPGNYDSNHNLGEFYIAAGKLEKATSFLQKAQHIKPEAYDNGYDLSLAYLETGHVGEARDAVRQLIQQKNTAELHNLLAQIEEKDGHFVIAEKEYETAAHMEPSEGNLFDWGSELLLHRTLDPAVEVFRNAAARYPASPRLAIGLGMALYTRGNYDEAVTALLKAADLNPVDPRCYYFLSKAYDSSPGQASDVIQHFRNFAELQPHNGRAQYYYAMSLWKSGRAQDTPVDLSQIQSLFERAIALDPKLAEAHLQLGNIFSERHEYADAVPHYQEALALSPDLADAHYRLGQALVHTGQKAQAQQELESYQRLRAQHVAELEKQRSEIRQFIYSEKQPEGPRQ